MRWRYPFTLTALCASLSCGGGARRDLQVMSFAPGGAIDKAEPISMKFDKPVVDEAMVGKPADPSSVSVSPAVAWKGYWQDRATLVIDPTDPLAPSTRYTVSLAGALAARTDRFALSFVHRPLAVEGVWGIDRERLAANADLPISFNQPVRPVDVAKYCHLLGHAGSGKVALVAKPGAPASANVTMSLAHALEPAAAYTLTCSGLTGDGGNVPLAQSYTLALKVRPELAVQTFEPVGNDVPADEVPITIAFSTPVSLEAARKALTSKPAIAGLDQGYLSADGTEYRVVADLDTETTYTLEVASLVDTAGQKLAVAASHTFKTGDARPRLSMERGIYAVEASATGYPVWTRNIGKYAVECAAIPKDRIVQLLTTDMNYDPWGGNADAPIDWKKLRVTPRTVEHTSTTRNKWHVSELDLGKTCGSGARARGVYLAEVRSDEIVLDPARGWLSNRRNRVLANVTDMGVLIKTGSANGIVWVTSLSTGQPVAGARVTVYTPQGKQVWSQVTTAEGLAKIPGSAVLKQQQPVRDPNLDDEGWDWDSYRSQRLIAIVEKDRDLAVVDGNWANGIQIWNFGVPEERMSSVTKIRGFIQSDRGLYRPGEHVHFKGIVRELASGRAPRVPANASVDIEVQDARGQVVVRQQAKLTAFGGFAFDYKLGDEAAVGDYYVRATVQKQLFRERFTVEEFRPATFELDLESRSPSPRPGERLAFELEAKHLMGAPATGAHVEWSLRKRTHVVRFPGYESYSFGKDPFAWWMNRYGYDDDYGDFIADGVGKTDAHGKLSIATRDGATKFDGPVDYILSANVTDEADQTMGKTVTITAHQSSFYLGLFANEYVQAVGMPFGVNLVALAPDGKRVGTTARLSVIRNVHQCQWTTVAHRSYQRCDTVAKPMVERDVTIAATGSHVERIYPTEPGEYAIKLAAKDDRGNEVVAASGVYIIGKGEAFWSGDEGDRMTLVASKPSYQVGDTARLVAQANLVKPTALITVERDGIIDARVQQLASASEGVELTIADAWAPNVFASVALVQGRNGPGDKGRPRFKMGMVELAVSTKHKALDVRVSLERATVRPGEPVSGKIVVTNAGKPVKAEVALSAADEGVLQLIAYATPDPMKAFYASHGLGVDAGTNWNRVARIADPSAGDPDSGGDSRSGLDGQRVRSKFVASAHWAPMLYTDERGEVAFKFVAPDNLTAFRLMAVAADAGDRFGSGEQRLTINKPLMAQPALPRFLRSQDAASVGVVLHNHTDVAGLAIVTAKATGASLLSTQERVTLPARGSARVRFAARAADVEAATFEFGVAMGAERDAVRITLPVDRPRVYDTRTLVDRRLARGETWTGALGLGTDVLRTESMLTVSVDRSGMGDLAPGLRALVEYPYGCLEQTMSRFVPLVAARDLAKTLDEPALQGAQATQFVRAGVQKVIRHQQGDGMFSLWPQSQSHPHLAAYALWGLTVAQNAGETVPAEVFERGIAALQRWANGRGVLKPNGDGGIIAMSAYVMAMRGKPDHALNMRLYAIRTGLPKWGQAFLLRALGAARADRRVVDEMVKQVEGNVDVTGARGLVHEVATKEEYAHVMNSDIRATAMTLAALLEVVPSSSKIDALAAGLKAGRSKDGSWVSTQENVWSLVALAEYARRGAVGESTVTVTAGGKQILRKRIAGAEVASVKLPLGTVSGDALAIVVDNGGNVTARVREARVDSGAVVAHQFALERRYLDATGKEVTTFKAGDRVTVQLKLKSDLAQKWVALVDPLPAGFEVMNPKLAAGGTAQPLGAGTTPASRWGRASGWIRWDHQELRDDRVLWFADTLGSGEYLMTYQARATIDGTFTAMPAHVEAMYEPDQRARTLRTLITVTP